MHPWHNVKIGNDSPSKVTAVIEIPKGSKNKYELDKETGLLKLDRVLFSSVHYPANYGFIPQTYCEDQDPLDILVLGQEPIPPLCLVEAKPIGYFRMLDQGAQDDKIISVHANDPEFSSYNSVSQLPKHLVATIENFFIDYKKLENKTTEVESLGEAEEAKKIVKEAELLYQKTFLSS